MTLKEGASGSGCSPGSEREGKTRTRGAGRGSVWTPTHLLSGRGEGRLANIQRKRGKGFYGSKRRVRHFQRCFESVRDTTIHLENFAVGVKSCFPLVV